MSSIYVGRHTREDHLFDVLECEMNSIYWDAFGVLLEEVLLLSHPHLYDGIAREEFTLFEYYTFTELSSIDFNLVVKFIRKYMLRLAEASWKEKDWITDVQLVKSRARQVWFELLEPLVIKDDRYDKTYFV
ncbi:hypothetical protein OZX61_12360 (plasmid) [Acinetobacter sp. ESL0695]|uniref:hypothetical protein n=1 Tax=Acinetobacter sp. ESL0695 TaxID=2983215 RepID=UPI0023F287B4|nr:hypothetical protein [Acinetobacter sp. ESL0695]WEV50126.1 hypothetical protein OZX61_12360 [Acinetobacter sp. ESL0695]